MQELYTTFNRLKSNEKEGDIKKSKTITTIFKEYGLEGCKNRKELAMKIYKYFAEEQHLSINKRKKPFRVDRITEQICRLVKMIKNKDQLQSGWWKDYEVIEHDGVFKLIKNKDEEDFKKFELLKTLEMN
jgi:hypothetical protein